MTCACSPHTPHTHTHPGHTHLQNKSPLNEWWQIIVQLATQWDHSMHKRTHALYTVLVNHLFFWKWLWTILLFDKLFKHNNVSRLKLLKSQLCFDFSLLNVFHKVTTLTTCFQWWKVFVTHYHASCVKILGTSFTTVTILCAQFGFVARQGMLCIN